MKKLVCILTAIIFFKCSQPIINPIIESEKKLILSSFFTSDKPLTVWLGYPHDILKDTIIIEANATIQLFENEQFIENLNYISNGHYQSDYILKTGQKYRIEAYTDELSVSAEDIIPEKVLANTAFYEYVELENQETAQKYHFQFQDIFAKKNYYEFLLLKIYHPQRDLVDVTFVTSSQVIDPILENEDDAAFEPSSFFFSDELINGQTYKIQMQMEAGGRRDSTHSDLNLDFIIDNYENYLVFRTISKTYYDFQKSWVKHRYNQNLGSRLDNEIQLLFGGEAQPLMANIKNGYGIFAAYQEQIIPFEE